ncbi:MAG: hypothetical protein JJ916_04110 [Phycisphaerales bacterium]|nr:hypothetical protein [Phycisphaerales bacterium]
MSETEQVYWYQCQERAMAPGSSDGWPEIIPAPHTPNARLKRVEGDPVAMIDWLHKEITALKERAVAVVNAWDEDDVGQIDGGLIDDLREACALCGEGT